MLAIGADPAKGVPVHRGHAVSLEQEPLQHPRRRCPCPRVAAQAVVVREDPQSVANARDIWEHVECALRHLTLDSIDRVERADDPIAAPLER